MAWIRPNSGGSSGGGGGGGPGVGTSYVARVATVGANIVLVGGAPNVLNGEVLAPGDIILVKDQLDPAENGVYQVSTLGTGADGTWGRIAALSTGAQVAVVFGVYVQEGTKDPDTLYEVVSDPPYVIGVTPIFFEKYPNVRVYPPSGVDPVASPPSGGDLYYNTVLQTWMYYDSVRSKWLSTAEEQLDFGRVGVTAPGSYFQANGVTMSATLGLPTEYDGTVIGFAYNRANADATVFEVTADGVAIASVVGGALVGLDSSLDADFTAGQVLGVRIQGGGGVAQDMTGAVRFRWRA